MKFRIFGGADCSDMFLAQLVPVVGLAESDVQQLAERVVLMAAGNGNGNGGALSVRDDCFVANPPVALPPAEIALAVCAVHTVLANICRFDVDAQQAARELVILGLAQPAADALVQVAKTHREPLLQSMAAGVRMAPAVARMHVRRAQGGAGSAGDADEQLLTDEYVVTLDTRSAGGAVTAASGGGSTASAICTFAASGQALRSLLAELITAREVMKA
jgi:hypothetical protein